MAKEMLDRPLRYFVSIAELGSLSRAADALDQTQSGLSKQLALLESRLGAYVFTRYMAGRSSLESSYLACRHHPSEAWDEKTLATI